MPRIVNVGQLNYRVRVQTGGNIILDTGDNAGTVIITGNLTVQGITTTIDTTNLNIEDNIILLNKNETSAGISSSLGGIAGIEIDRGSLPYAQFLFDESLQGYVIRLKDTSSLLPLATAGVISSPTDNFTFDMQDSESVITVVNTTDTYAQNIEKIADKGDIIPNIDWIRNYSVSKVSEIVFPTNIESGYSSRVSALTDTIKFFINEVEKANITTSGLNVNDINLNQHTISSTGSYNLILSSNTNNIEINGILNLDDQASDPSSTNTKTKLYSKSNLVSLEDSPGRTGLHFVSSIGSDELVSKNRALLFSMLF